MRLFLILVLSLGSCTQSTSKPSQDSEQNETISKQDDSLEADKNKHFTENCSECHEDKRPLGDHIQSFDCMSCHNYPSWSPSQNFTFNHQNIPPLCETCHLRPDSGSRAYPNQGPPPDFMVDNNYEGSGHYLGKDCKECHQIPNQPDNRVFTFTHSTPSPNACLPCHYNEGAGEHPVENSMFEFSRFGNCHTCHVNFDRNGTRNFDSNTEVME